jgi:predicted DNA-binding ribbon-helix-helix protein
MKKRSVTIAGHATSITLEDEFWSELKTLTADRNLSINALITDIDDRRVKDNVENGKATNLSSAIRLEILRTLQEPNTKAPNTKESA